LRNWFIPNKRNSFKPYLLRNTALSVYTFILFTVNILGGFLGIPEVSASSIAKDNIIRLTNAERQKFGLNALKENSRLSSAALAKANNMIEEQYWDHFGPNGETPWQFIKASGYQYIYAGENLAKGFKSSEGVVQAWMASPTHRENILSGNYKEIGIATVTGELLGENIILVVQMFGNTTSEVTPSAPPTTPVVPEPSENGDIKSIKITYPAEGSVVTDPSADIKGEVFNVEGEYKVEVYDKNKVVGNLSTNGSLWDFRKDADWSEGSHNITATLVDSENKVEDSVTFEVDSTPPQIDEFDIAVEAKEPGWVVTINVEEDSPDVTVVVGSKTYPSSFVDNLYKVEIEELNSGAKVVIVASDKHGNTLEYEITDLFEVDDGQVLGGFLNNIDIKDTVNTVFVIFIFILLLIEIVVYARKGLIKEKRSSLFSISMWWLLMLIGTLNGFEGVII